ncbi:nucleoid-associated protein [Bacteroides fragilis]
MQNLILGELDKLVVHYVGNKTNGDGVRFSNVLTQFENIEGYIKQLISNNFKLDELYCFYFLPKLELNPMFQFVSLIFEDKDTFVEQSQNSARYLYDKSIHPQVKGGELCFSYFKNCELNGDVVDCIGIFKSENKETVLKVSPLIEGFELKDEKGINTNKIDKGCLVFNTKKENGYIVSLVDNTNKTSEAQYWKDEFLKTQPVNDEYHQTKEFLNIAKNFVTKELSDNLDVSKTDKIDLLNRSVEYFKKRETFDKNEFEQEVFQNNDLIDSFRRFDETFRKDNEIDLSDNFEISSQAVKKTSTCIQERSKTG